jgi:TIR domain
MIRRRGGQRVFISYSLRDAEWARSFARDLVEQGFDVSSEDWTAIRPGEDQTGTVAEALRDSDIVALVLTDRHLDSPWMLFELGAAMAGSKAVVAVVAEDVDVSKLPVPLQRVVVVRKESPRITAASVASGLLKAS